MKIKILKPGLLTTIQDIGRHGEMCHGIAHSGAMDHLSMKLANWLVNNPLDAPVLEITIIGPTIQFSKPMSIAVCGADFDLFLNGEIVFSHQTINVKKGDVLEFDHLNSGARAYLSFAGRLKLPPIMNSYSTNLTAGFGGYFGKELAIKDKIKIKDPRVENLKKVPEKFVPKYSGNYYFRCVPSVESDQFSELEKERFSQTHYQVTPDSNRMGIRLKGDSILTEKAPQIISSGLTQGSVQITPSGMPIVSSVDGQTIGGYPRIANIISADLPLLGQLRANDKIRFGFVSMELALQAFEAKQTLFDKIIG
ncbi:biotin-dependent carboxyltransferase family protein [Aliikangiella marina]|uniref:Biotin-dependent carboxyltransferase family protein n=1 Tax=Aliikangiella marina TaxID=1712262 RepID=A0A545T6K4_9GAMM|nr:biotin-dependent carboxyltransferase family protein [Aliikangiella marina]TQV72854.1 biotin-dependent carboxyltransferase family protein [Aliikangiella marina]